MVYNFTASANILGFKAWRFGLYFVLLDIIAFIIQAIGAIMASGDNPPESQIFRGRQTLQSTVTLQTYSD